MKLKITIIITLFLAISCNKDNDVQTADISGQWEWIKTRSVYPSDPVTPENSGIYESLILNKDHEWWWIKNGLKIDSGTYMTGHGSFARYLGAQAFIYDSVLYHRTISSTTAWDYYIILNDTLQFCPGFAGKFASLNSFNFPIGFNGAKFWIRKKIKTLR